MIKSREDKLCPSRTVITNRTAIPYIIRYINIVGIKSTIQAVKEILQTMNHLYTKKYLLIRHLFLSFLILVSVLTITGCEQPFSRAEVSRDLSSDDVEGAGVRLEYGSGTVCSVDFVRSLVFVQPEAELPGFKTLPSQIILECEYLDITAVVPYDHVVFYYHKENISSDRIKVNTLLDYGQNTDSVQP